MTITIYNIADFLSVFRSACRVLTVVVATCCHTCACPAVVIRVQTLSIPHVVLVVRRFFVIVARGFLTMPFFHTFL